METDKKAPAFPIQLIVGLGNPGPEYADTRHNAGEWFAKAICENYQLTVKSDSKFNGRIGQGTFGGQDVKILIPNTYMNHSGQSVGAISKYYDIPPEAILVAHDELDLQPGTARLKSGGGHAGHNGLRDIIHHLHTREFHRLRFGIGHPGNKDDVSDYVLHKPSKTDRQRIQTAIEDALSVLPKIVLGDWKTAMSFLHSLVTGT